MELTISYSQLMLMNYDGDQPYVDWTDEDFERGYAKADGTVIFEALSDYTCEVKVTLGKHIEKEEVIRTVTVPFTVENECIVVASILSNKFQIPIPNGEYTVVLQATPLEEPTDDELYKIQYEFFFESKNKKWGILKKDTPFLLCVCF
ncbi:competence protein ComJ [Bacillus pacificus]